MRKQTVLTPVIVGAALIILVVIMAVTDIFHPVVQFIHTGEITLIQAVLCILATVAAFALTARLLIMLGGYFLPKAEERRTR